MSSLRTVLLVRDLDQTLLTRIPGSYIFNIRVAEVSGETTHDSILASSITEGFQCHDQVILMLPSKVGITWFDTFSVSAMTGMADCRFM